MSKDPAFLFYPGDWLSGTMGMTLEEKGAYMELLILQFNRGHMTSHMIGQTIGQLWVNIQEKFVRDADGKWYNERLDLEKERRKRFTESRKNNLSGKNQYSQGEKNNGHLDGHMTSHMENENEDVNFNINVPFDTFWNLYDKKVGDKSRCEKKWNKLKDIERQKIIETLPAWKKHIKDKQFQPYPETYLNQRRWNDELEIKVKPQKVPH